MFRLDNAFSRLSLTHRVLVVSACLLASSDTSILLALQMLICLIDRKTKCLEFMNGRVVLHGRIVQRGVRNPGMLR
jgi:hypothetical protein